MSNYTMISVTTLNNHGKNTYIYTQGTLLRKIKNRARLPSQLGPTCPIFREWTTKDSMRVLLLRWTIWLGILGAFTGKQRLSSMLTRC
jgi:hypothetical protein